MTPAQTAMIATAVADILKAYGEKHVEPLAAENAALRGRLESLEAYVKALPAPRDGIDGKDGAPGADGKDGAPGRDGVDGAPGRDGIDGAPGAKGDPGDRGEPGIAGKDGAPGLKGDAGETGRPGVDGKSVDPAEVRTWVMDEVAKAIKSFPLPRDGRDGRNGVDGPPGRDAAELMPEDGMNESASYQRGTWVMHRGGLFLAYRATDPVQGGDYKAAGWHVVNNGLADMRVELAADQRTLLVSLEGSDGRTVTKHIKTAMQIHRGVWRDGITYERGDNVSSGGSTWHANETTTDKPGEGSKAWTLTTKRGRDGKDAGDKQS